MMIRIALSFAALLLPSAALAHGGGLDSSGCHNDRRRGEYHCHRGASARATAPARRRAPAPQPVMRRAPVAVIPVAHLPRAATPETPGRDDAGTATPAQVNAAAAGHAPIVGQARVLDGDTIEIGGQRIRLWGIDAFEAAQRCWSESGPTSCGASATHHLANLIADNEVICAWRDMDRYNRVVGQCRVRTLDIGAEMIRSGWAIAYARYAQDYVPDQAAAQADRAGAWAGSFDEPASYRSGETNSVAVAQRRTDASGVECRIKGNIRRDGTRVYHLPGTNGYDRTVPEAMFCSVAEAEAAGFRRAGDR